MAGRAVRTKLNAEFGSGKNPIIDNKKQKITAYVVGDFVEFVGADAKIANDRLGISIHAHKNGGAIAGIPKHSLGSYIAKSGVGVRINRNINEFRKKTAMQENDFFKVTGR